MAVILQFKRPEAPPQAPQPAITEYEGLFLDVARESALRAIDVVNAGTENIRGFIAGDKKLSTQFSIGQEKYRLVVELQPLNEPTRTA